MVRTCARVLAWLLLPFVFLTLGTFTAVILAAVGTVIFVGLAADERYRARKAARR